ncbi:hypothetical protein UFOVP181_72 [uncultured Caudovirales phage]|uniref:Major tropism determinant N-terminal domain-containing protein n=1 Tax=uncultured Caudovirales phage TaxID=2100421 RepID=A0A6J5KW69_9CAUD|nr:hypothetical protein UFOVP57_90 [uncultured Caudovirales phage]CAB5208567.1 hypothetical protein UFOVP181_72 [uncultured Caudovirales phage]
MSIQKLRSGRVPTATASTYIGEGGTIFWNSTTGEFRLSDGVTPGGSRVGFPVASLTEIGGIKLGPGVTLNGQDQLVVDPTGLDFAFGDFYAFTNPGASDGACLSSVNANQDINIVSNGTGNVNVIGEFNVHATDGVLETALSAPPIFKVTGDGQVTMLVPKADQAGGALEIVGNDTGLYLPPDQTGVILHITGNSGLSSRSYFDANANYTLLAGRRYNGTQLNPTKVLNGEVIFRIAGQAATQATTEPAIFQAFGPARIEWVATQDQQPNKQGGEISIYATANDTAASASVKVATFNATTGLTATKFNGPLTGNVTGKADTAGNADTVTNGVYTNGSYANPAWITSLAKSKVGLGSVENTALSTSTFYLGTTQITYNRASAAQTLAGVSVSGNAGTVTNGVYTTDTGTVTNTMLAGSIANNKLANSTIQVNGVTLTLGDTAKTITAAAGTLTGTELNSTVVTSSLTALGGMSTIKAGTISAAFNVPKNTPIATQTFTVSGLTTSHKIIITSNTAMPDSTYFIPAAWVSATNTVSIQIAHTGGGAFTTTFDISYFAWV